MEMKDRLLRNGARNDLDGTQISQGSRASECVHIWVALPRKQAGQLRYRGST